MTLQPDRVDWTLWKGATFNTTLFLYTDDAGTVPWDLTGYTALMQLKDKAGDTAILLSLTTENDGIIIDPDAGSIQLKIEADVTAQITWKRAVYDLTISAPSGGDTDPLIFGTFKVQGV